MLVVAVCALILTWVAAISRLPAGLGWPVFAGIMTLIVLFSPFLAECYKRVRGLGPPSRRPFRRAGTQPHLGKREA